jgi:acyl-CoA thioester hydrolase
MVTYNKTLQVVEDDLDDLDHVNNVRYVQWIQDISKEHWQYKAPKHIQETMIWVVLNHHIFYKSAAKLHDRILIKTHIAGTKGAVTTRVVEMVLEGTEQLLVRSETEWCLLSAESLRPIRISEEIQQIFSDVTKSSA